MPESDKGDSPDVKGVQSRLVEAGERLFCQHGFNETSVRDIAAVAGCNAASVNYYFGGKENLYLAVWRQRLSAIRDARLASIRTVMAAGESVSLEALLQSYARAFVGPMLEGESGCRFVNLMARELMDRRLPREIFVDEMISPVMKAFGEALQTICPWLDKEKTDYTILSVVGQLVHAVTAKEMFECFDHPGLPRLELEELVDHVVKFSAAGIRAYQSGTGS